jgi:hypothetical protein
MCVGFVPLSNRKLRVDKKKEQRRHVRLLAAVTLLIFVAETSVMLFLSALPPISLPIRALLDALMVVVLILPALYFFSFRPLISQLTKCQIAERQLEESNKQAHLLSGKLLKALEEERERISRDLHDEIAQFATSIKMELDLLYKLARSDNTRAKVILDGLQQRLDEMLDSMRRISFALRPTMLNDVGLVPTIESYLEQYQETSGIQCEWDCRLRNVECSPDVRITIYRVLQEALTNVMRHAEARSVRIALYQENGKLSLVVEDRGRGFDTTRVDSDRCLGLVGMTERAQLVQGKLAVFSRPGAGTRLEMEAPNWNGTKGLKNDTGNAGR